MPYAPVILYPCNDNLQHQIILRISIWKQEPFLINVTLDSWKKSIW